MEDIQNFTGKNRKSQKLSSTKEDHSKSESSSEDSDEDSNLDTALEKDLDAAVEIDSEPDQPVAKRSDGKRMATSPATTEQPLVQRPKRNQKQ